MQVAVAARPSSSQETLLHDFARQLDRHREDRQAVHVHLSKLRSQYRQAHHLRIAQSTFEDMVRSLDGRLFVLSSGDIVFVLKGTSVDELDRAVLKIRYLFSEDSLTQLDEAVDAEQFCTWYDLETDYPEFLSETERLLAHQKMQARREDAKAAKLRLAPLTPARLGEIEAMLAQADLSSLLREQPVCAVKAGAAPQPVMKELYISIADLRKSIAKGIDLAADRWLFQRLTQTLDRRVLAEVSRYEEGATWRYFTLNINVATILSPEFLKFDGCLRSGARGTIVLELAPCDVFADIAAYSFARDFVKARGYRVCLDGLNHLTVPLIDRARLGLDLVKIHWHPDMADDPSGSRRETMVQFVKQTGTARVILCRCDSQAAIDFGLALGLSLFQGRQIDAQLKK